MTNPDNVGGLPELPKPGHYDDYEGEWYWTGSQMRAIREESFKAGMKFCRDNELCRAAPAGGDAERGKNDPSWSLFDRVDFALRDAGFDLDEAANIAALASGSAPAGSGEVDALCQWFWDNAMVTGDVTGSPDDYREHAIKLLAFLRKLQQEADYVMVPREPTEAMMNAGYNEVDYDENSDWDNVRNAYLAMIAASQGQEGGANG